MKAVWISIVTFAVSALAVPALEQRPDRHLPDFPEWSPPDVADLDKRQYERESSILSSLLSQVQFETALISLLSPQEQKRDKGGKKESD